MNVSELEMSILNKINHSFGIKKVSISNDLNIDIGIVTRSLRQLKRKGLVELYAGYDDCGYLCGSYYCLTNSGKSACGLYGEHEQDTELKRLAVLPDPKKITAREMRYLLLQCQPFVDENLSRKINEVLNQ